MGKAGLILILALLTLMLSTNTVEAREAKGATKRKVRSVKLLDVDIEDLVRAEDDPNFAEYLKERERQQQVDEKAVLKHKQERQAFEDSWEKGRRAFIEARSKQRVKDELEGYDEYIDTQNNWYDNQEKGRQQFVVERKKEVTKVREERQARLQKAFPNQRMPASIDEPKYPRKKR